MTTKAKKFFDRTAFLRPPAPGEPLHGDWTRMHPSQQAMLATDGSMTLLLAGLYGEAIAVKLLHQAQQSTKTPDATLQVAAGEDVLQRNILLKTADTGRTAAYAESSIVVDRLPNDLQRDLNDGDKPIGLVLRDHDIPTVRHLEQWGRVPAAHAANEHLQGMAETDKADRTNFYRSYIIAANIPGSGTDATVPIMRVAEYFPFHLTPAKELAI